MAKEKWTCPVPLFDKLIDQEPEVSEETVPFRTFSLDQLKESIQQELSTLLNHRRSPLFTTVSPDDFENLQGTVLFYGAIDFSTLNYQKESAWQRRLEDDIRECILHFEPRLKEVAVQINQFDEQTRLLSVTLSGTIEVNQVRHPLTFPVDIHPSPS